MADVNKSALIKLNEEIKSLSPGNSKILAEKIESVIKEFNYRDVPVYNRLNELQKTLLPDEKADEENFNDIKGKLLYLTGLMLEKF